MLADNDFAVNRAAGVGGAVELLAALSRDLTC
jgi:hypothetical protein